MARCRYGWYIILSIMAILCNWAPRKDLQKLHCYLIGLPLLHPFKVSEKMQNLPKVSVIVLNYNGKRFLDSCISALLKTNYPSSCCEFVVVDNGSIDDSVSYIKKNFPYIKLLELGENYGFTVGNNKGEKATNGEFIVFLNNDTIVDKDWLLELVTTMLTDAKIGICGSKIAFMERPNIVQYAGGYLHAFGGIFSPFHNSNPDKDFYYAGSICGASFLIRRNVFEEIGGFDEDFFLYADEVDLCLRVWLHGYRVAYCPRSVVYHYAGGSAMRFNNEVSHSTADVLYARLLSPANIYHGNKNSIALIIKNFQLKNLVLGITFSYIFLFFQFISLLCTVPSEANLLVKAAFWPIKNFRTLWKKRVIIQNDRKVTDDWLERNNLLLPLGKLLKLTLQLRNDPDGISSV